MREPILDDTVDVRIKCRSGRDDCRTWEPQEILIFRTEPTSGAKVSVGPELSIHRYKLVRGVNVANELLQGGHDDG
jgi:hypothetical protein